MAETQPTPNIEETIARSRELIAEVERMRKELERLRGRGMAEANTILASLRAAAEEPREKTLPEGREVLSDAA